MWSVDQVDDDIHIWDDMYGVVTGSCSKGLFLMLENGQEAFSRFGSLAPGSEVLCSVIKKANENWRYLVSIDSVIRAAPIAA